MLKRINSHNSSTLSEQLGVIIESVDSPTKIEVPRHGQRASAAVAPGGSITIDAEADDAVIVARTWDAANNVHDALHYQPPATFSKKVLTRKVGDAAARCEGKHERERTEHILRGRK